MILVVPSRRDGCTDLITTHRTDNHKHEARTVECVYCEYVRRGATVALRT